MAGLVHKSARDLTPKDVKKFITWVSTEGRYKSRNRLIACLSFYSGLRASEIANLRWRMVLDEGQSIGNVLKLENKAAKMLSGRHIPLKQEVKQALEVYWSEFKSLNPDDFILRSQQGSQLTAQSIINWFRTVYTELGINGASSHSGRRYFVTFAARKIFEAGGSLRDVQELAGHRSLSSTQLYIARNSDAQVKVVNLI